MRRIKRLGFIGGVTLLLSYAIVLLVLVWSETSLVFPIPRSVDVSWQPTHPDFEDVKFKSSDGTVLHGWLLRRPNAENTFLLCHGNAESVEGMFDEMLQLHQQYRASVFAFDYRGYGSSQGEPTEEGILIDVESALDWLCQRCDLSPKEVIVYGRSLGGGVAVHIAARKGARALILERTFSSAVDVAAYHYPLIPVRWLMQNQFHSIEKIKDYHGPLLQIHGRTDEVIPYRFAKSLFESAPTPKEWKSFIEIEKLGHEDPLPERFHSEFAKFIHKLQE